MALVASGKLSLGDINEEFGFPRITPISLRLRTDSGNKQVFINNGWVNLNPCSVYQPDTIEPHSISEWYQYDHNQACCIRITDFNYTMNDMVNANNFNIYTNQSVTASITDYIPTNVTPPMLHKFILDGTVDSGYISSPTQSYSGLSVGNHNIKMYVYNCDAIEEKTAFFTVSAPTTPPPTTSPACISISDFNYTINGTSNGDNISYTEGTTINISIDNYTPSNATAPIQYRFTYASFDTGITSTNSVSYSGLSVGNHNATMYIYSCGNHSVYVSKTVNFSIVSSTTIAPTTETPTTQTPTTSPTTSPITTSPPSCSPVTDFTISTSPETWTMFGRFDVSILPNGTSPFEYNISLTYPNGIQSSTGIQSQNGARFINLNCGQLTGDATITVTVYNCSRTYSLTKNTTKNITNPNLYINASACLYGGGQVRIRATTNIDTTVSMKLYDVSTNNFITDLSYNGVDGGVYDAYIDFILPEKSYYVSYNHCGYTVISNYITIDENISSC